MQHVFQCIIRTCFSHVCHTVLFVTNELHDMSHELRMCHMCVTCQTEVHIYVKTRAHTCVFYEIFQINKLQMAAWNVSQTLNECHCLFSTCGWTCMCFIGCPMLNNNTSGRPTSSICFKLLSKIENKMATHATRHSLSYLKSHFLCRHCRPIRTLYCCPII